MFLRLIYSRWPSELDVGRVIRYVCQVAGRINARIDAELSAKLAELSRITGQSTTSIIKAALSAYFERVESSTANPKRALEGFIGCAEGDPELATRYKATLRESWGRKT